MWRRFLAYLSDAVLDGAIAGAALGAGEATHALIAGSAAGGAGVGTAVATVFAAMALVVVGMLVVGPVLALLLTGVGRLPPLARLRVAMAAPGESRAAAVVRVVIYLMTAGGFTAVVYAASATAQHEFKAANAIALLVAAIATVAAIALLAVASALDAWGGGWLGRRHWLQRLTRGRLAVAIATGLGAAVIVGLLVVARVVSPEADLTTPTTFGALGLLVLLVRGVGVAHRLQARRRMISVAALALVTALGLAVLGQAPAARALLLTDGAASPRVLRQLWAWTDRDGDGASAMFGGADCDDDDARVRPTAREIIGNGIDDNCRGGELADTSTLGPRIAAQPSPVADRPRRNVIIISVDALRADHLGADGYPRKVSPTFDKLAATSTRFTWAVSPSPTTRRAVPALMSGRYASALRWQDRRDVVRVEIGANPMLGELFTAGGYDTQAIMCCTTLFDKPHGVVEGIKSVDAKAESSFRKNKYNAQELSKKASDFLATRRVQTQPFFLWMHFIEPHNPYVAAPGAPLAQHRQHFARHLLRGGERDLRQQPLAHHAGGRRRRLALRDARDGLLRRHRGPRHHGDLRRHRARRGPRRGLPDRPRRRRSAVQRLTDHPRGHAPVADAGRLLGGPSPRHQLELGLGLAPAHGDLGLPRQRPVSPSPRSARHRTPRGGPGSLAAPGRA